MVCFWKALKYLGLGRIWRTRYPSSLSYCQVWIGSRSFAMDRFSRAFVGERGKSDAMCPTFSAEGESIAAVMLF
jgi:hypothetical protein